MGMYIDEVTYGDGDDYAYQGCEDAKACMCSARAGKSKGRSGKAKRKGHDESTKRRQVRHEAGACSKKRESQKHRGEKARGKGKGVEVAGLDGHDAYGDIRDML